MRVASPRDLACFIRGRRWELKLTQTDLAKQVGVGRHWIAAIEQGKVRAELGPTLATLQALGVGLHLTFDEIPAWTLPITYRELARRARLRPARARKRAPGGTLDGWSAKAFPEPEEGAPAARPVTKRVSKPRKQDGGWW